MFKSRFQLQFKEGLLQMHLLQQTLFTKSER